MQTELIVQWLQDTGLVLLNGLLELSYLAWEHGPLLLSLLLAAVIALGPDRSVQRVAGHRPRRRGRGAIGHAAPAASITTAVAAACWTGAAFLSPAPVRLWGLALWGALLAGALVLPQERENVLWTHKGLLLGYAALAVGLRWVLQTPAEGWAELMGVEQSSAALLSMVRQALAPWAVLTVWAVYPIAYLGLLGQRLFVNRTRLVGPLASVRDTVEALRTRGEA